MDTLLRRPGWPTLALALALLLLSVACGRRAPQDAPPVTTPPAGAAPVTQNTPLDAPLPAPLPWPADDPSQAASALAAGILSGGDHALPALLAAMEAAGVAVRGPDGAVAVAPPGPGQGLALSAWEARLMTQLMGRDRAALVPLTALEDLLLKATPELEGVPVAQLILDGVRAYAQGDDEATRAWAMLIVELGRQRTAGGAQDLLAPLDPAQVQLDAVQLSLITQRLAGDLAALEAELSAAGLGGLGRWLAPATAHAAAPCAQEEPPVVDMEQVRATGFDALKGMLRQRISKGGLARAGRAVRDYRTLVLALAALRIEVGMEPPGPPLVRTKTTDPGEERTVKARVYLDPELLGTVECARTLLAALGLTFNVDSPSGGGIAGVPLTWRLVQGHDVLLAQEGEDRTGPDGSDSMALLGRPQERHLGAAARQVTKQGAVAVRFSLRPYTLVGSGAPPGARLLLPPELLLDLSYGYEVTYPFAITDWEEGGRWTGTITYTETRRTVIATQSDQAGNTSETTETLRVTITLGEPEQEMGMEGGMVSILRAATTGEYSMQGSSSGWYTTYCGVHGTVRLSSSGQRQMHGAGSGMARVIITILPMGGYTIGVDSVDTFDATGQSTGETQVCRGGLIETRVDMSPLGPSTQSLGIPYQLGTSKPPPAPNVLRDSLSEMLSQGDTTVTRAFQWDLRRT